MKKNSRLIMVIVLVVIAILSIIISKPMSTTEFHKGTIESLTDKEKTVMALTAGSVAASAAISAIPGDAGTPIAQQIADLSKYFLVILSSILLEKYLITMLFSIALKILVPAACVLLIGYIFYSKDVFRNIATKLIVLSLALLLIIPTSVKISNKIEEIYDLSSVAKTSEEITDIYEEAKPKEDDKESSSNKQTDENAPWYLRIVDTASNLFDNAKEFAVDTSNKIAEGVTGAVDSLSELPDKAADILSHYLEAIAIMMVTSCLIPILVLIFYIWLLNAIFKANFSYPVLKTKNRNDKKLPAPENIEQAKED